MNMKKTLFCVALGLALLLTGCGQNTDEIDEAALREEIREEVLSEMREAEKKAENDASLKAAMDYLDAVLEAQENEEKSDAGIIISVEEPEDEPAGAELAQRYQQHMAQAPEAFITCPVCNGTRKTNRICKSCNGTGEKPALHPTPFLMSTPCGDCMFTGYEPCDCLLSGQIPNPDYQAQHEAWDAERRDILHQAGFSDLDIAQMDLDASEKMIEIIKGQTNLFMIDPDGQDGDATRGTKMCRSCYGTGRCHTCNNKYGDLHNGWTGDYVDCPNCIDGRCSRCGGTGKV